MTRPRLAVMLRVHHEHRYLRRIRRQLRRLARALACRLPVVICCDRPAPEVEHELHKFRSTGELQVLEYTPSGPLVDEHGEHFMEELIEQYARVRNTFNPAYCVLLEDDGWMDEKAFRETVAFVKSGATGCLRVRTRFMWDGRENTRFPAHWNHHVFWAHPDDDFTEDLMIHCPRRTALEGPVHDMEGCLINYGYNDSAARARNFEKYRQAGKVDRHTLCLTQEPIFAPKPM